MSHPVCNVKNDADVNAARTGESRRRLHELISRQPEGCALLQEFYADPEIYGQDLNRVHLRHWLCAGHQSRVPKPGDFFVFDTAGESVIIIRGKDQKIRALLNVCRHRGSQVCYEKEGNKKMLVCPYHAWGYGLDGSLRAARHLDAELDRTKLGLKPIHLEVVEGLILVNFADDPPKLTDVVHSLDATLKHYGWADAVVAHRATYSVDANWKLATENYMECYHCSPAHPEFAKLHATEVMEGPESDHLRAVAAQRAREMGIDFPESGRRMRWAQSDQEGVRYYRDALYRDARTGSEDGKPLAPLMGNFTDYDGGFTYADIGPASFFLAYPDHGVMYLFIPRGTQKTDMEIVWLVRADAEEGVDYELERLIWLWDVTTVADKLIIERNQMGVNSRYYVPGPFTPMEEGTQAFVNWYLEVIGQD